MRQSGLRTVLVTLAALGAYAIWSHWDRRPPADTLDLHLQDLRAFGTDHGCGNLLGIQPYMVPGDYASEARFYAKLDGYLAAAQAAGFINAKTVVVLPEYLGAWLAVAGEKRAVYTAPTIDAAMRMMALSNTPVLAYRILQARGQDRLTEALFRLKAWQMAGIFQRVFSQLARKYHAVIVAGSIILPSPRIEDGMLVCGDGPLVNAAVVFAPDGKAQGVIRKAHLTSSETPFLSAGEAENIPIFDTPAGRLGVLVCADAWFPATYERLRVGSVELIAVPSYRLADASWTQCWNGYDGAFQPSDVDPDDLGVLNEGEALLKYALPGRISLSGARAGINVFLRGHLWELGSDGSTLMVHDRQLYQGGHLDGATISCLWL